MITADELARRIEAEAALSADPPVSPRAVTSAAHVALALWGDPGAPSPDTYAA